MIFCLFRTVSQTSKKYLAKRLKVIKQFYFYQLLKKNNCKLIFKPHPHQEEEALNYFNDYHLNNLLILKGDDLESNQLDLYELLNVSEILITDYSSIFYDFLLLDRRMIFTPTDIDLYKENRGFVVESFERWTLGSKALTQDNLQTEISKSLSNNNYYGEERKWILDLNHRYKDGNSSKRLWNFIDTIMPHERFQSLTLINV